MSKSDIVLLVLVVAGCISCTVYVGSKILVAKSHSKNVLPTEDIVEAKTLDEEDYLWLGDTSIYEQAPDNIMFSGKGDSADILFEWTDGKFNVVYDPNRCTKSAITFFECILPYLNEHIEQKAKELTEETK